MFGGVHALQVFNWIRYAVGYVFIVSGVVKLLVPEFKQTFLSLGFPNPNTTLFLLAMIEIICGVLMVARMYVKQATIPLIIIMIGALAIVKLPYLLNEGILSFVFESRLDIVMLILLVLVWRDKEKQLL